MKSPIITASPMIAFAFASAAQGAVVPSSPLLTRVGRRANANTQSISRRAAKSASVVETSDTYLSYAPVRRSLDQATTIDSTDVYLSYGPENAGQVQSRETNHTAYFKHGDANGELASYQPPMDPNRRFGVPSQKPLNNQPPADSTRDPEFSDVEFFGCHHGFADEPFTTYQTSTNFTRHGFTDEQFTSGQIPLDTTNRRSLIEHEFFNCQPTAIPPSRKETAVDISEGHLRNDEARKRAEEFARLEAEADAAEEHGIGDSDDEYLIGFLLHKLNR
ncbi:hypothetical protein D9619_011666 [Psilocybe cf. subviscida]|uniref:Uncharacterized protein n=1 Tax=Psilocybe cf. subviscida TaxID=2480587 RepID=A0A8H5BUV7_9AGAR|nr:hypothetical protein D9619_011666 [Psilocybe cf. subviscida]